LIVRGAGKDSAGPHQRRGNIGGADVSI